MPNNFEELDASEIDRLRRELWRRVRIVYFDGLEGLFENLPPDDRSKQEEALKAESKEEIMRLSLIILAVNTR